MFKKLVYSALFAKCVEADRHLQSNSTMPLDPAVDCGINQTLTADGLECDLMNLMNYMLVRT